MPVVSCELTGAGGVVWLALLKVYRLDHHKVKYTKPVKGASSAVVKKKSQQHTVTFVRHEKSVEVIIRNPSIKGGKAGTTGRGSITELTYPAIQRMRLALEDTADLWKVYAVLTYPSEFPWDGRVFRKHRNTLLTWLRDKGIKEYFWGLEFQERGAPHINLLLPCRVDLEAISREWFNIVGSNDPNHLKTGVDLSPVKDKDRLVSYLIGYFTKDKQKEVPGGFENVGRFWGCHRYKKPENVFTRRFNSQEEMLDYLRPVVDHHESNLAAWHEAREKKLGKPVKPYKWRFKEKSWVMWSGRDFVEKYIEEGENQNEQEKVVNNGENEPLYQTYRDEQKRRGFPFNDSR